MLRLQMFLSERWIFWKNLLCPLYAWPRPQHLVASLKFRCQQGECPLWSQQISAWIDWLEELITVNPCYPDRFLFILLGPHGKTKSYNEIGRAIATLMVDDVSGKPCFNSVEKHLTVLIQFCDPVFIQLFSTSFSVMLHTKPGTVKIWLQVLMSFWMRWSSYLQGNGTQKYASNRQRRFPQQKWGMSILASVILW